jgi:hypothetical protein
MGAGATCRRRTVNSIPDALRFGHLHRRQLGYASHNRPGVGCDFQGGNQLPRTSAVAGLCRLEGGRGDDFTHQPVVSTERGSGGAA